MKYLMLLVCSFCVAQSKPIIETTFLDKTSIDEKGLIYVDDFNTSYHLSGNNLTKSTEFQTYDYSNIQLNNISSVDLFNPLKINLFYQDFNTVIILDNRLAEIYIIDFNRYPNYKNVSHVSTGSDNTIWVYNQDNQQLELFDYNTNKTRVFTLPILTDILDLKSNYNYAWLLTKDYLFVYNYFGSLLYKVKNNGFSQLVETNGNLILKKGNTLFYLKKDTDQPIKIQLPKLLITAFFVNDETLYIYDTELLYKYQLKIN